MSKYVKEMMMDQLRSDLDGEPVGPDPGPKGLDAVAEHQLRRDLRKKSIRLRALKNTLARRVFADMGMDGLSKYLKGPSVAVWGGDGVAELAKEISTQVKKLKKPEIKGGAVDGVVIGPEQVEDITKLPSREALIGQVVEPVLGPAQRVAGAGSTSPAVDADRPARDPRPKRQQGEGAGEADEPAAEGEADAAGRGRADADAPADARRRRARRDQPRHRDLTRIAACAVPTRIGSDSRIAHR